MQLQMTIQNYRQALTELDEILKQFPPDMLCKIPNSFINFVHENKDDDYIFIRSNGLKRETIAILSIVYKDYICSLKNIRLLNQVKSVENSENSITNQQCTNLIQYSEPTSWYSKIKSIFKKIFNKTKNKK